MPIRNSVLPTTTLLIGIILGVSLMRPNRATSAAAADAQPDDLAALKTDVARLKTIAHDQSHAMSDVGYHYSNLWFAGQAQNWPLARFYFDETRSHLQWAVRIIPMRKDSAGRDVDLNGILTALEQTSLKDLDESVKARDAAKFTAAYKAQLENCMACHRAASKEYLQLRLPERPESSLLEFKPQPEPAK
jgi:hypothetical protein